VNKFVFVFIGIFIFSYGMINYYIGLRGWQALGSRIPWLSGNVYWAVFWFIALSYLVGRLGQKFLPTGITYWLTLVGAYWLAAMFYFFIILAGIDLVLLLDRGLGFIPESVKLNPRNSRLLGHMVLAAVTLILIYGTWNARHPRITHYDISIPKQAGDLRQLRVVMVSDIHLGEIIHNGRLTRLVEAVNRLNPDVVLMPGDIIDEHIGPFVEQGMINTFRQLTPRYGIYAVPGNHEYIGGHIDKALHYLNEAGIEVLLDRYSKVAESFYIIGRDDRSGRRFSGRGSRELADIMTGIDRSLPIILLDHQPSRLEEARLNGVDLQLSGHTHRGQLFPNHLITQRIYEIDWGILRKGSLQVIVSSGFGTWGPPIRVGNYPEVVDITINFEGEKHTAVSP